MSNKIDKQKLADWLNSHWVGDKTCSICRHNNWNLADRVQELRDFNSQGFVVGGPVIPVVVVTCLDCGHTLFFNGLITGAISTPPSKESKPANPTPETIGQPISGK